MKIVQTESGAPCSFPFVYYNQSYYNCIINGPNNPFNKPQCLTINNIWSFCQGNNFNLSHVCNKCLLYYNKVPTDAVITYVTTRKAGNYYQNGASLNGETLVWIYGYR